MQSFAIAAPEITLPLIAAFAGLVSAIPATALANSYEARINVTWFAPLAAIVAGVSCWQLGAGPAGAMLIGASLLLLCAAVIDFQTMRLPNIISVLLALLALGLGIGGWRFDLLDTLTGAVIGPLVLFAVDLIYRLFRRKSGVGMGDLKLMVGLGGLVGPQGVLMVLIGASLLQAVISILLLFGGPTKLRDSLPFGPALAVAGWGFLVFMS